MTTFHRSRQPGGSLARRGVPRNTKFQHIPVSFAQGRDAPFRIDLGEILTADEVHEITAAGSLAFHCVGDTAA